MLALLSRSGAMPVHTLRPMSFELYDTKDAVPEAQRATAVETKDGKWAAPKVSAPLGDGGESALKAERDARKAAEKLARDEKKRADDLERQREADAANIPKDQLEKWRQERDDAVAAEQAKTAEVNRKLDRVTVERHFREIAMLPDVNMFMERLDEDNLAIVTRRLGLSAAGTLCVTDADGQPTTEDPKAHILAMKAKRPYLFRGPGSNGSGSEQSNGAGGGGTYDAVAAGKAAAAAQKQSAASNALAFK